MYKLAVLNYATKRMNEDPRRRSLPSCMLQDHFNSLVEEQKVSTLSEVDSNDLSHQFKRLRDELWKEEVSDSGCSGDTAHSVTTAGLELYK